MPIPIHLKLNQIKSAIRLKHNLLGNDADWIVWWYCGVYKNIAAQSQPNILVAFRQISSGQLSDDVILRRVPLTALGQVRIGTVWNQSRCHSEAIFDIEKFRVDFTEGSWKLTSFASAIESRTTPPYPQSIYPLQYKGDKNWLIEFKLPTGGKLLVPCLEFFYRCYGLSAELKRVLATYPWHGEKDAPNSRFFAPIDEPEEQGKWKVKLKRRLVNGDVVLLAHAKYDRYTELAAKSIYSQIDTQYDKENKLPAFIKVAPWFQGPAELKAKGIWFDEGRSFLALQVIGCSEPGGVLIARGRENTNKTDEPAEGNEGGEGEAWAGVAEKVLRKPPEIIDLTGDVEPDHGAASIEIEDPDFEILGVRRVVIDIRKERVKGAAGKKSEAAEVSEFSSGEPYGAEKGVGYASIHAKQVMESRGALRDMWNAMQYLHTKMPDLIQSVEWYTFQDGYRKDTESQLVALRAFSESERIEAKIKNWPYLDASTKQTPRGILVARLNIGGKHVHIVEVQRRSRTKKEGAGNLKDSEESFKGLVFVLDDQADIDVWLRDLLSQMRYVRGIVKNLVGMCPGMADVFNHAPASDEQVPCEAALLNALGKMGIKA